MVYLLGHATCLSLLFLLAAGCGGVAGSAGESVLENHSTHPTTLLVPSASTIDLGMVPQSGQAHEYFALTNPGTESVEVAKIETSCECLKVRLTSRTIGPTGRVLAQASLDLGNEPQFSGGLAIEVRGLTNSGAVAFAVVVDVTVRAAEEFQAVEDPS